MAKKIIDITPPPAKPSQTEEVKETKEKKARFSLPWKILTVLAIVIFGIVLIQLNSKVELKVQPHLEPLTLEETFEVKVGAVGVNAQEKIIPGRFFEETLEKWQQFESTGISQKTGKASGKIRVYNSHHPPTSLNLRATTRFLSSEGGKVFRSPEKIYLPPAKLSQGKIVPSSVEIEVEAQEPGEDYNIGPSKFSLPGLAGTAFYYTIYAESDSPMTGGFVKEVKIVSQEDIEKAKNSFENYLLEEAKKSLGGKIPEDFVLLDNAMSTLQSSVDCLPKPESEIPEFSCQGEIEIKGIAFNLTNLKELSAAFIENLISANEKFLPASLSFKYLGENLILEKGKLILDLEIAFKTYQDISLETLAEQIEGKSKEEIEEVILDNYPQVEEVKVKFWPFWTRTAPKTSERIKIELTF